MYSIWVTIENFVVKCIINCEKFDLSLVKQIWKLLSLRTMLYLENIDKITEINGQKLIYYLIISTHTNIKILKDNAIFIWAGKLNEKKGIDNINVFKQIFRNLYEINHIIIIFVNTTINYDTMEQIHVWILLIEIKIYN